MGMFDFPKDTQWLLQKFIKTESHKPYYYFEAWTKEETIADFRRSTPSAMAKAIKALIKKLKTE